MTGRVIDLDDIEKSTTEIAEHLEKLAEAMRRLLNGKLKEEAIIVLLRELLPKGSKLSKEQMKEVLDAVKRLDTFVRKA